MGMGHRGHAAPPRLDPRKPSEPRLRISLLKIAMRCWGGGNGNILFAFAKTRHRSSASQAARAFAVQQDKFNRPRRRGWPAKISQSCMLEPKMAKMPFGRLRSPHVARRVKVRLVRYLRALSQKIRDKKKLPD